MKQVDMESWEKDISRVNELNFLNEKVGEIILR